MLWPRLVAGWRNNEVWFSVPYYPHSWPLIYVIAVEADIVGLGVYHQSLIILTRPALRGDRHRPENMSLSNIQPLEPCTSRHTIVNTPNGVLYSSPNGLINITASGAMNLTLQQITKDQWADMLHLQRWWRRPSSRILRLLGWKRGRLPSRRGQYRFSSRHVPERRVSDGQRLRHKPGLVVSLTDDRMGRRCSTRRPAKCST